MELDQLFFKKVYDLVARLRAKPVDHALEARTAKLVDLKDRLTHLARILTGQAIEIMTAEAEGGYTGRTFFLPASYNKAPSLEENIDYYVFRTCYLATQKELNFNWQDNQEHSLEHSREKAIESSDKVLNKLFIDLPGVERIFDKLQKYEDPDSAYLWGKWFITDPSKGLVKKEAIQKADVISDDLDDLSPSSELEAPAKEMVNVTDVDQKAKQDYTLQHHFEKVDTIDDYDGVWRDTDGSDELDEHEEALDELSLQNTVRVDDPVHTMYRSEHLRNAFIPIVGEAKTDAFFIHYDEWDTAKKQYQKNYCKVFPAEANKIDEKYLIGTITDNALLIRQLRKKMARVISEREQSRRQYYGDEIDLDMVVENYAELQAGKSPSERVYIQQQKKQRDISILLLMDLSLSTDAYTNEGRILDIEKQAVICFAEVLEEFYSRFQIDGFSSRTRNNCDYVNVKKFDESWAKAKTKVGGLEPAGYTRIGPALRHATAQLAKEKSRKRWIILLSDGKPNDYDRYEGIYGVEDIRKAVLEAREQEIYIFTLAIEKSAKHYLPRMFGQSQFRILAHASHLPEALGEFYLRISN